MDELEEFICKGMRFRPIVRMTVVVCDEKIDLEGLLTVAVEVDHLVVRDGSSLVFVVPIAVIQMLSIMDCKGIKDAV